MKKQLATLVAFLTAIPSTMAGFIDLSPKHPYFEAIEYIQGLKMVQGYPDGSFQADRPIDRYEFLKIVIESLYSDQEIQSALNDYLAKKYTYVDLKDVPIDQWFSPHVRIGVRDKIIEGNPNGLYLGTSNINFVEALKIVMQAYEIPYNENANVWYEDMVNVASQANVIPLDITAFDQKITRGQMAELITRVILFKQGDLNAYLGDLKDIRQTYQDIENGVNQLEKDVDGDQEAEIDELKGKNELLEEEKKKLEEELKKLEEELQKEDEEKEQDEASKQIDDANQANIAKIVEALETYKNGQTVYPGTLEKAECLNNDSGAGLELKLYMNPQSIPNTADPNQVLIVGDQICDGRYLYIPLAYNGQAKHGFVLISPMVDSARANFLLSDLDLFTAVNPVTSDHVKSVLASYDKSKVADAALADRILVVTN